ncbi:phospho-sugar mutase [Ereboglobus luteus]|uniref:Phosphoglucomutase n=1 Tax=Ereboglobus luteus TaxID=1796921 RepID=A0A2U8E2A7_9BACT|nr:phospho-sugar mutase [Ereboglobus luteus]AWI08662.1 phosphoglucomutase [Ereboglobus luteus]
MSTLKKIQAAAKSGALLPSTATNLADWLAASLPEWAVASIGELVEKQAWPELNDRFYRYLEFGTGGMRGRTIGAVPAAAETGKLSPLGTPEHAAIGSNVLNDFTLIRAVIGLYRYTAKFLATQNRADSPKLVIAHDVRHFSRHFCELAASTWTRLGGTACIFDGPRSTPQLSFSVRYLKAHAGVVITASHNPPHDNGFKAYFEDGAQVIAPHDKGIVAEVNAVPLSELGAYLDKDLARVITLTPAADAAYHAVAAESIIDKTVFKKAKLKVAFTNIHGTGAIASVPLLKAAGALVTHVPQQAAQDPRFPTVKSPNPENAEALSIAVALAEKNKLDVVLATDPDCDRMGVAVRNKAGKMELLTGNQVGALFADYRITKLKQLGRIPKKGGKNIALIKTFVTTPLQDAIGAAHGVKVINTLTGFKWIAAKIRRYEEQLKASLLAKEGIALDYDRTPHATRAKLLQKHSTYFIFGNEESYGYLDGDDVRDKDGNTACLMFAELCAYVKSRKLTVPEYLDEIYRKHGYFMEGVINIYYEGATGAAKIKRILETYRARPPKKFGDIAVKKFQDFGRAKILDADGERIPAQDLYFVTLANGYTFAARGSGTEPKIKFYIFANAKNQKPAKGKKKPTLAETKAAVKAELERVKTLIETDARNRAES